ncbi:hypothetical protein [Paraburkholderia sp.]|jgi:hypothetical protein|uniref:hypothetical protein n=1 Tax=Paraburkholderia sp. TaxID=1926495 RepID=UPI003C515A98
MSKRKEFQARRLTKLAFSFDALEPIRQLYHSLHADQLSEEIKIGIKAHEDYGDEFANIKMRWYFANSPEALQIFRDVLDGCELAVSRDVVGSSRNRMRVIQANIVEISGSYPEGRWHSDFADPRLGMNESATLLTPLLPFESHFGGLETTSVIRGESLDYDDHATVHRYREGEAILFDGTGTIHRTQSYQAAEHERRVLVCWQFGDVRSDLIPVFRRIGKKNGDPMFMHGH